MTSVFHVGQALWRQRDAPGGIYYWQLPSYALGMGRAAGRSRRSVLNVKGGDAIEQRLLDLLDLEVRGVRLVLVQGGLG